MKIKFLVAALSAFVLGVSVANVAMSDAPASYKVAVVDVQKVVNSSSQVAALKKEQEAKSKELVAFVEKARKDVAAQADAKKKQDLETKYNKELNDKKAAMDKNYAAKLQAIDTSISKQIDAQAKTGQYDLILAKGVVLSGGIDITDTITKLVK
ncbi:MAG: OmpH family outer membrane protein [Heliobacteriaceae bacterium]|jgi:Skp family chaperone for outer membrane proteins|nr:OmpH family outer membrane protein [Heliobacteriaceae bacterium]